MSNNAKWSDLVSLDGPRSLAAANQLLPAWVSLLLVIVIGWQLAKIGWALLPGPSAGDPVNIPAGASRYVFILYSNVEEISSSNKKKRFKGNKLDNF